METKLCFMGHVLMGNRCGLLVDARLMRGSGHAERVAALEMIAPITARSGIDPVWWPPCSFHRRCS